MKYFLIRLWDRIPTKWKYELYSGSMTFLTAAIGEMAVQYVLTGYALPTSLTAVTAIVLPGIRMGFKSLALWWLDLRGIKPPSDPRLQ